MMARLGLKALYGDESPDLKNHAKPFKRPGETSSTASPAVRPLLRHHPKSKQGDRKGSLFFLYRLATHRQRSPTLK
jgi:hypothetical protein